MTTTTEECHFWLCGEGIMKLLHEVPRRKAREIVDCFDISEDQKIKLLTGRARIINDDKRNAIYTEDMTHDPLFNVAFNPMDDFPIGNHDVTNFAWISPGGTVYWYEQDEAAYMLEVVAEKTKVPSNPMNLLNKGWIHIIANDLNYIKSLTINQQCILRRILYQKPVLRLDGKIYTKHNIEDLFHPQVVSFGLEARQVTDDAWISPTGEIFWAHMYGHIGLAEEICDRLGVDTMRCDDWLADHNWIRLSSNNIMPPHHWDNMHHNFHFTRDHQRALHKMMHDFQKTLYFMDAAYTDANQDALFLRLQKYADDA